jgi:uncharacterized Ntn-hydrolase superfamily protein
VFALLGCGAAPPEPATEPVVATFSIVAFDPATGDLGVAVQSRVFGVGVVVPWVRADVGAVATQAMANPAYGPEGLALLDDGESAAEVVAQLTDEDDGRERRQVGVVDARGGAAAFTGKRTLAWAGHRVGTHYCCQGNILAGARVVDAMAETFEASSGALAERLVAALAAGQAAGGDKRGRQSAALLVARRHGGYLGANDRYIDIRVDDHPRPIDELARLLQKRRGFGREARVPRRVEGLVREPRISTARRPSARGAYERWMRLRDMEAFDEIYRLTTTAYRTQHSSADLEGAERRAGDAAADARRLPYLGTKVERRRARLYFDDPKRREPVVVVLVEEDDRWCIVPAKSD